LIIGEDENDIVFFGTVLFDLTFFY